MFVDRLGLYHLLKCFNIDLDSVMKWKLELSVKRLLVLYVDD